MMDDRILKQVKSMIDSFSNPSGVDFSDILVGGDKSEDNFDYTPISNNSENLVDLFNNGELFGLEREGHYKQITTHSQLGLYLVANKLYTRKAKPVPTDEYSEVSKLVAKLGVRTAHCVSKKTIFIDAHNWTYDQLVALATAIRFADKHKK